MDWLGKFLDLPKQFLNCSEGPGGGVIQGSASEAILVAMLTAREQSVQRLKIQHPELSESVCNVTFKFLTKYLMISY